MDNTSYNTSDVKKVCETKLQIEFRDAKEYNGWYLLDGKKVCRITVSKGKKFIPPKTYKTMAGQLKLAVKEFDQMLACPLSKANYDLLLIGRVE